MKPLVNFNLWHKNKIFSKQTIPCFLYNYSDKHHMLYFKIPISRDASQWESLPLKVGGKAKTWIKGLKKLSNNNNKIILISLTGQHFIATSPFVPGSISVKFVYVYKCILSSLYTKGANFIRDPTYQGTVFKQQPVFPRRS